MRYRFGVFIFDSERDVLILETTQVKVTDNPRIILVIKELVNAYPKMIAKEDLIEKVWPKKGVTEWALSRLISKTRLLLASFDNSVIYIKTVHSLGFKLEIEPVLMDEKLASVQLQLPSSPSNTTEIPDTHTGISSSIRQNNSKLRKGKVFFGIGLALLVCIFLLVIQPDTKTTGSIRPAQTIPLPTTSGWNQTLSDSFRYTRNGVELIPLNTTEDYFVLYTSQHLGFLQGAVYSLSLDVAPDYVGPSLIPYVQAIYNNWPGEWDCSIPADRLREQHLEYQCVIDENASWTNLPNDMNVVGIKVPGEITQGSVTIKSASISLLPSISVEKGWIANPATPISYENGVSYQPKSSEYQLSTLLKGPLDIKGSKLAFTIEMDAAFKKAQPILQFFLMKNNKNWSDCTMNTDSVKSYIFTYVCDLKTQNPLILLSDEKAEIGLKPHGNAIDGTLKIIGITVKE